MDFARRESDVGEISLAFIGKTPQIVEAVRDVILVLEYAVLATKVDDLDVPPVLRIDDEDPCGPDDDEVDLRFRTARPLPVGEDRVAARLYRTKGRVEFRLTASGDTEVAGIPIQRVEHLRNATRGPLGITSECGC
jgi:hypothetical protein